MTPSGLRFRAMATEPEARARASEVRKATSHDRAAIVPMLARAFDDDPVWSWLFPWDDRRPEILRAFFDVAMHLYLRNDEVELYGDAVGAALWAPPGKWRVGPMEMLRSMPKLLPVMRSRAIRGMQVMTHVEKHHPHEPHRYLAVLGTEPEHQGEGIGSALLRSVLERCDREKVPAYLESSSEGSKRLYERHGFRVTRELPLPPDGPPVWLMWRDPVAA
jgi:ribosomal protein S18 acetylase RimI-like enzyme